MNNEIKKVIEKFKEVKNILKDFSTKDWIYVKFLDTFFEIFLFT